LKVMGEGGIECVEGLLSKEVDGGSYYFTVPGRFGVCVLCNYLMRVGDVLQSCTTAFQ
jgi:hypothetical protein